MSNLDNLVAKIIEDGNKIANSIIEKANEEGKLNIDKRIKEANIKKDEILKNAEKESKSKYERIISNAHLNMRNKKLEAKQNVIDNVFDNVVDNLVNLPLEKYLKFIKDSIVNMEIDGDEEIIFNKNDKNRIKVQVINDINKELKNKGKKGQLKISNDTRDIKGGFILTKGGIEINASFEAIVFSIKDELEKKVYEALFNS
ncbi:V-type proton ATPase subunit E [Clostridium acetireducens DSM 10703]|uniref:V-type proton ATPase subunit E n=1 Tax=Clostridium acetireducens DSM 10703 TaxID=1121290 RepID=A0A1E8EXS2_9CLOT|nr:V-type ATP synthase subunit E [Clostridium acetireducens]OFI05586.1 V-type proton ATPase subunit E [Clostridium acetireducens DSM 10703]